MINRIASFVGVRGVIALPMIWLLVFFLLPFIFVFVLSFSTIRNGMPPYEPVVNFKDSFLQLNIHLSSWERFFENPIYIGTFLSSAKTAFIATFLTLLIGFPMAYVIARAPEARRHLLLMLVILPFWTSFLLRVYAIKTILYNQGPVNQFLMKIGILEVNSPIQFLNTDFAVYLGIVYTYLPFMILPLYANLVKLEESVLEASSDLGAKPFWTFWQVVIPLSYPGIIAGCMLVFIPAVGEFVIPDLLGATDTKMIGKTIYVEYFNNRDYPMASVLSVVVLIVFVAPFLMMRKWQDKLAEVNDA